MTLPVVTGKTNTTVTRDDHPAHHNDLAVAVNEDLLRAALTPVTPARALDTNFQPSATRPVFAVYTVKLAISLLTTTTVTVELRSDAANPPTTVRAQAHNSSTPAIDLDSQVDIPMAYIVPTGHFVRLQTSGTGTATLVRQTEIVL